MRAFGKERDEERLLKKAADYSKGLQQSKAASMPSDTASTAAATASTVSVSAADAGGTYTAGVQSLINENKADLNTLVANHNALVTAFTTLVADHNDLVTRYNTLLVNLRNAGLMQ